jgi:hypothetical protein
MIPSSAIVAIVISPDVIAVEKDYQITYFFAGFSAFTIGGAILNA